MAIATVDVTKLGLKQARADTLRLLLLIIICKPQPWQCFYVQPEEKRREREKCIRWCLNQSRTKHLNKNHTNTNNGYFHYAPIMFDLWDHLVDCLSICCLFISRVFFLCGNTQTGLNTKWYEIQKWGVLHTNSSHSSECLRCSSNRNKNLAGDRLYETLRDDGNVSGR